MDAEEATTTGDELLQCSAVRRLAPFTEHHAAIDGEAAAYVCRDFACKLPFPDPADLDSLLSEASSKTRQRRGDG